MPPTVSPPRTIRQATTITRRSAIARPRPERLPWRGPRRSGGSCGGASAVAVPPDPPGVVTDVVTGAATTWAGVTTGVSNAVRCSQAGRSGIEPGARGTAASGLGETGGSGEAVGGGRFELRRLVGAQHGGRGCDRTLAWPAAAPRATPAVQKHPQECDTDDHQHDEKHRLSLMLTEAVPALLASFCINHRRIVIPGPEVVQDWRPVGGAHTSSSTVLRWSELRRAPTRPSGAVGTTSVGPSRGPSVSV